jgi:hypothetical protein
MRTYPCTFDASKNSPHHANPVPFFACGLDRILDSCVEYPAHILDLVIGNRYRPGLISNQGADPGNLENLQPIVLERINVDEQITAEKGNSNPLHSVTPSPEF